MLKFFYNRESALPWAVHGVGAAALLLAILASWHTLAALFREQEALQAECQAIAGMDEAAIRERHASVQARLTKALAHSGPRNAPESAAAGEAETFGPLLQLAERVDLEVKDFHPAERGAHGVRVRLSATGSFASICRFLHEFETLPNLFQVQQCGITPGVEGQSCKLELSLRLLAPDETAPLLSSSGPPS